MSPVRFRVQPLPHYTKDLRGSLYQNQSKWERKWENVLRFLPTSMDVFSCASRSSFEAMHRKFFCAWHRSADFRGASERWQSEAIAAAKEQGWAG